MQKTIIRTDGAPAPMGPYNQGITVDGGRTLYVAGQVPIDPPTGELCGEGDIAAQTEQVLDNIEAILREAGMGFEHLVKVGVFLADFGDAATVNQLYAARFGDELPVRTTVPVGAFPRGFLIEMDAIAIA